MSTVNDNDEATIYNSPRRTKENNHIYFQSESIQKKHKSNNS